MVGNYAYIFGRKCKIVTFGIKFSREMFSYLLQFTCYLYDAVNKKNNLSFKFLRTVEIYANLKICIFERNLTDFENRLKT